MHIKDGKIICFKKCAEGIFYTNLNEPNMITDTTNVSLNAYYYLSMVKQNLELFTGSETEGAQKVLKLKQHLYCLGTSKFNTYLQEGMICNCPINTEHSARSDHIYGPSRPLLQGGVKRRRNPVNRVPRVPMPTEIYLHHKNIKLYFNYLYERNAFPP